jgi:hypothetical protein
MAVRLPIPLKRRSGGDRPRAFDRFPLAQVRAVWKVLPPFGATPFDTAHIAIDSSGWMGVPKDPRGLSAQLTSIHPQALRGGLARCALSRNLTEKPLDFSIPPGVVGVHHAGSGPALGWIAGESRGSGSVVCAGIGGRHDR